MTTMPLSDLPDIILLKIFDHLPIADVVRCGRVDRVFREVSLLAISRLQSICMDPAHFGEKLLDAGSFGAIMDLCHNGVKRIKLGDFEEEALRLMQSDRLYHLRSDPVIDYDRQATVLVPTLCRYQCPKLVELDIRGVTIGQDNLHQLIRNNPNLRHLSYSGGSIPNDEVLANMESIQVVACDEATLRSLVGTVPNLRHFTAHMVCHPSIGTFNNFCQFVPNLRSLELRAVRYDFGFNSLPHLFNLVHLESLIITRAHVGDADLIKVARSFPRLQHLEFTWVSAINDRTFEAFRKVDHLRVLKLDSAYIFANVDESFKQFMIQRGPQLRELHLPTCAFMTSAPLISAVRSANDLRLSLFGVRELSSDSVTGTDSAMQILEACRGMGPKKIQLKFKVFPDEVFGTASMKEAIKKLEEEEQVVFQAEELRRS